VSDETEAGKGRVVPAADTPDDTVADGAVSASDGSDLSLVKSTGVDESRLPAADELGAGSTGTDRESELVGAVSAGSARAAARRSGARAGSTPAKGVPTKPRDTSRDTRGGIFARLRRFLREVVAELRKVIWPARNQMITYTIVVIVFVVVMVAITAGLDVLFAKGVLSVFG
jgi:preprotein translocase subunit SecE